MQENKYDGMTVNERLFVSGLINEFDIAVKKRDYNKIISILKIVDLTDLSIEPILEQLYKQKQ